MNAPLTAHQRDLFASRARHLATLIASRDEALHTAAVEADKLPNGNVLIPYVTVRWAGDRHPVATVWVDMDGYTWGENYQHSRGPEFSVPGVATAVVASLPKRGVR